MKIALIIPDNRDEFGRYGDPAPYFGPAPTALLDGFAGLPECEIHVLACAHRPMAAPPRLADNIHNRCLHVGPWGWLRGGYLGCIRALRKALLDVRPRLVHGQGTERYCALAAVHSGFPNVLTLHGNMRRIAALVRARPFTYPWLAARFEAHAVARSGGVICLSSHTRRAVEDTAQQLWTVPNAVDAAFFGVRREPGQPPTLLCAGNILPWKNQIALVEALDSLAARLPFRLDFRGKADPANAYAAAFLETIRSRPWCRFLGNASPEELRQALAAARAVVVPSIEDNCPMVILEAMAAGVPVLASRAGGMPDLVEEGSTGFLFDAQDAAALRDCAGRMLQDESLALELGQRARLRARERFDPPVVARRHLEIYREFLENPAARKA